MHGVTYQSMVYAVDIFLPNADLLAHRVVVVVGDEREYWVPAVKFQPVEEFGTTESLVMTLACTGQVSACRISSGRIGTSAVRQVTSPA